MANSLVDTTFKAGPDDKLIAVDVYGESGAPGASNRIQAFSIEESQLMHGGFGSSLEGAAQRAIQEARSMSSGLMGGIQNAITQLLGNLGNMAGKATSLLSGTPEQIKINKDELLKRLLMASSEFASVMRNLPEGITDKILNSMPLTSDLMCSMNDVNAKISSSNLQSVDAVGKLINEVSKSKIYSTQDTGALAGIYGSIIGSASALGMPNAFQAITGGMTDNRLITAITKVAVPQVLGAGDMQALKSISETPSGKLVEIIAPGSVAQISKAYRTPTNITKTGREDYSVNNVMETITNLKPNWDLYERNGNDTSVNLVTIMGGSDDFKKLLRNGVTDLASDKKIYLFASLVKQSSVGSSLKKDFPALNINSLQKTRKIINDVMSPNLGK